MKNRCREDEISSFIERTLFWEGCLTSKYLADNFNLTLANAEIYLSDYIKKNPENVDKTFSDSSKIMPNDTSFEFVYSENNFDNILTTFTEINTPFLERLPVLQPVFDKEILKKVVRAMNNRKQVLTIRYQSLNSGIPEERNIIPYSIYYVRGRYHLRGYCLSKEGFRDFVLSRIISIVTTSSYKGASIRDIESSEYVSVIVKPHTDLSDMQKMCTEIEFGMKDEQREIKIKKSLLIYLLDELRVGKDYYRPPFTVLELVNKSEVNEILKQN